MNRIFTGGYLVGRRTYIVSGIGILTAVGSYLVGDIDIFGMLQAIFTLGGIYFLRKESDNKKTREVKNGKRSRKVSE